MNFDQNNNFEKTLFNTEKVFNSFEANTGGLDSEDLPPQLDPIKNLSDATTFEAPTMEALDPINFIPEFTPESSDPLDTYEKYGFNKDLESTNILPKAQLSIENSNYNQLSNENIDSVSIPNFNAEQKDMNLDVNDDKFKTYFNKQTDIKNDNSFSNDEAAHLEANDNTYEIIEKSLLSKSDEENSNQIDANELLTNIQKEDPKLTELNEINSQLESKEETYSYDNIVSENNANEDDIEFSDNVDKFVSEEKTSPDKISDNLENSDDIYDDDIDLLGLDDVYTKPDSLEILDDDIIDELELNADTSEDNINSVDKIKLFVEELKSKGEKIKVEEFDFEAMHQLIIIIEK